MRSFEIWRNMARLCLTSKRVDVASICFARMKNVGACRALRICMKREDVIEAQVAMVALQLDMIVWDEPREPWLLGRISRDLILISSQDEAERLFRGCGRYDLLVDMLVSCHQWQRAVEVCENHYRIQYKTTCFLYAKYLEEEDSLEDAIQFYEKAGTAKSDVMRMLQRNLPRLEKYVTQKKQKLVTSSKSQFQLGTTEIWTTFYD